MGRRLTTLTAGIAAAILLAAPGTARAATYIDGHCGMKFTQLVRRNQAGDIWKVRLGGSGSSWHCNGTEYVRGGRAAGHRVGPHWVSYDLGSWDWGGVVQVAYDSAQTVAACGSFGVALFAELPSGGWSTFVTAASGTACAKAVYDIGPQGSGGLGNGAGRFRIQR